jgi:hypothetical protein
VTAVPVPPDTTGEATNEQRRCCTCGKSPHNIDCPADTVWPPLNTAEEAIVTDEWDQMCGGTQHEADAAAVAKGQQRAAELWAALNIGGIDGEAPDDATVNRVAGAYLSALAAAEARGAERVAQRMRDLADEIGGQQHGIPGEAYLYAANRLRALLAEVTPPAAEQEGRTDG